VVIHKSSFYFLLAPCIDCTQVFAARLNLVNLVIDVLNILLQDILHFLSFSTPMGQFLLLRDTTLISGALAAAHVLG
jgi:hypothetical protein